MEQADRLADQARIGFRSARNFQGHIRKKICVETGMASWGALQHWSRWIVGNQQACSPERFATLVARHDRGLALGEMQNAWLIGGGRGHFNLNAYRCGTLDGVPVFEKIYQLDSEAWRRVNWAYSSILPRLEGRVRAPQLLHRREGLRLAAAYFEYIPDLTKIPNAAIIDAVREFQQQVIKLDISGVGSAFADFRSESTFILKAARLREILGAAGRDPNDVDTIAACLVSPDTRRVFAHGDFMPYNITAAGVILDWDKSGAYPPGYDIGRVIGKFVHFDTLADFDAFSRKKGIRRTCAESPGSLEFFVAVNYAPKIGLEGNHEFILALFDRAMELRGIHPQRLLSA